MKRTALVLTLLLAAMGILSVPSAGAVRRAPNPDPMAPGLSGAERLQALLERVRLQQKEVKTIVALFVQRRQGAMLVAPEQSARDVLVCSARPGAVGSTRSRRLLTVVIRGGEMTTWYRDLKHAPRNAEDRPLFQSDLQVPRCLRAAWTTCSNTSP